MVIEWTWEDRPVQIEDTAGIRKLTQRLDADIEDMAVSDALRAMKRPMWQCWYWMHKRNTCNDKDKDKNMLFAATRTCYCECGH
jgi:predicted GTPase